MAAHPGKCYAGPNCVLCQTLRARERGAKTKRTAPQLATRTTKSTSKRSGSLSDACGSLSDAEYRQLMRQLQRREELTPDDYELLLRLDEAVPKRDVLPNERVSAVVKQRDVEVDDGTCAVCVSDMEVGEACAVLCCGHAFHAECIHGWLTRGKDTCPVCAQRQC